MRATSALSSVLIGVEVLEDRRLLSATLVPHAKVAYPNVVGNYSGTAVFTGGTSDSLRLTVAKQHGTVFSGTTIQGSGVAGKLTGTVSRTGIVHATLRGTNIHFVTTIKGTFAGTMLSLSFKTVQQKLHLAGIITLQKFITTP